MPLAVVKTRHDVCPEITDDDRDRVLGFIVVRESGAVTTYISGLIEDGDQQQWLMTQVGTGM